MHAYIIVEITINNNLRIAWLHHEMIARANFGSRKNRPQNLNYGAVKIATS